MSEADKIARIFKVLSMDTRVRMIEHLKRRPLCVNALAQKLDISPSAVSQHLRILRDADIVIADRQGYFIHYRINYEIFKLWRKLADEFFKEVETQKCSHKDKCLMRKQ
jgi:ArsR family transcriptional regulator, arsenate/arsenite/antimonite-responsive transcriptional repressor